MKKIMIVISIFSILITVIFISGMASCIFISFDSHGPFSASIIPSRTSGVAPLAVFFEAEVNSNASSLTIFHDYSYEWDFGDPGSGVWGTSNLSKNNAGGPVTAHVFDQPGTYSIQLTVQKSPGQITESQIYITVDNPDALFSGTDTICFSTSGNFSEKPTSALEVTTSSFTEVMSYINTRKRLLLRRGENWTADNSVIINAAGPGIVGAFGSGLAPVITSELTDDNEVLINLSGVTRQFSDWRIMDLQFIGPGAEGGSVINCASTVHQCLMYRLTLSNFNDGITIHTSIVDYNDHPDHSQIAIVDCDIRNLASYNNISIGAEQLMIMGNHLENSDDASSNISCHYCNKGVISHNYCNLPGQTRNNITISSSTTESRNRVSRDFIVSDNIVVGVNNPVLFSIGPEAGATYDTVINGIVERNHFISGVGTQYAIRCTAGEISIRNNIINLTDGLFFTGICVLQESVQVSHENNRIYNNTIYCNNSGSTVYGIHIETSAINTLVCNNLLCAPLEPSLFVVYDQGNSSSVSNNIQTSSASVFINSSPSAANDFTLSQSSTAIDAGNATGSNITDFTGNPRGIDGNSDGTAENDAGAYEFQSP